ncbi:E3 ubiquitin- ligase HACE1 [Fusarium albosuccineum]|uniref:E3 ubiquitin- ligase HACE1 n=1 Tax=Fusarium albosuccineum TaxID=1237068 RepID=A0A8H4PLA1_9HYPO|nr:E3 ubiquitin- ligase HACE1 [Fusarium albosuccineum]
MAEYASAILSFVVFGLKAWSKIDGAIGAIKDAPRNSEHWKVIGGVLKESLSVMEKRIRRRGPNLTLPEQNLFKAINTFTEDFRKDLDKLERKVPKEGSSSRFLEPLRLKLQEDRELLARVSRNVHIFQVSAAALVLLDPAPAPTNRVQRFLNDLQPNVPEPLQTGDQPHLLVWREAIHNVADVAAQHDFPERQVDVLSERPDEDRGELPRRPSTVDPTEIRFRFEAAVSRARRMSDAGLPIIAKKAQEKAREYSEQLQAIDFRSLTVADFVDLEVRYIRILKACQPYKQAYEARAWEHLRALKSRLLEWSGSNSNTVYCAEKEQVGLVCAELEDHEGAVDFLRLALREYLLDQQAHSERIQRIAKSVCEQYEYLSQWDDLDAFKRILVTKMGQDPTSEPTTLTNTVQWCRSRGFDASEVDRHLHLSTEDKSLSTPLHIASADKTMNLDILHQLIRAVYHSRRDGNGDTPLLVAVEKSNNAVLAALLKLSGSIHVRDAKYRTPLHRCSNPETMRLLLEEVNKPAHRQASEDPNFKLVDIDSTDGYGKTALHCACEKGKVDLVETLVSQGADINAVSGTDQTPLMIVADSRTIQSRDRKRIIEALVNGNPNMDQKELWGELTIRKSLKKHRYTDYDIEKMLLPDPSRRFRAVSHLMRGSVSTNGSSERASIAAGSMQSTSSPAEMDAPLRIAELPESEAEPRGPEPEGLYSRHELQASEGQGPAELENNQPVLWREQRGPQRRGFGASVRRALRLRGAAR